MAGLEATNHGRERIFQSIVVSCSVVPGHVESRIVVPVYKAPVRPGKWEWVFRSIISLSWVCR